MNLTPLSYSPPSTPQDTPTRPRLLRPPPTKYPRELADACEIRDVQIEALLRNGFPRASLPLDVCIASSTIEKDHAVYHVTVTSRSTPHSWVVSYRYRQFLCLKTRVEGDFTCHSPKCSGSCPAIRWILDLLFPRMRLISSTFPHVVESRARAFENVLRYLLGSALLPGSAMTCTAARGHLSTVLFQFLRVQDSLDQRTLLQVYADNHHREVVATTTAQQTVPKCVICLDDLSQSRADAAEATAVIGLSCGHSFHRDCLFDWLAVNTHCPVCRGSIGPKAVVQYLFIQEEMVSQAQWWLDDFTENPLKQGEQCDISV